MNLNEIWHYDDPVDQWAARREFQLRHERYMRAVKGLLELAREFGQSLEKLSEVIRGMA